MSQFVEFSFSDRERFGKLQRVFVELRKDKEAGEFRSIEHWRRLFDTEALSHFWWPTASELADWLGRWEAMPVAQRLTDPSLTTPWDFGSMIDAFQNGEYDLLSCEMVSPSTAQLVFEALAWPYGGTGCMKVLVECFGFQVLAEDDGQGYTQYT